MTLWKLMAVKTIPYFTHWSLSICRWLRLCCFMCDCQQVQTTFRNSSACSPT